MNANKGNTYLLLETVWARSQSALFFFPSYSTQSYLCIYTGTYIQSHMYICKHRLYILCEKSWTNSEIIFPGFGLSVIQPFFKFVINHTRQVASKLISPGSHRPLQKPQTPLDLPSCIIRTHWLEAWAEILSLEWDSEVSTKIAHKCVSSGLPPCAPSKLNLMRAKSSHHNYQKHVQLFKIKSFYLFNFFLLLILGEIFYFGWQE